MKSLIVFPLLLLVAFSYRKQPSKNVREQGSTFLLVSTKRPLPPFENNFQGARCSDARFHKCGASCTEAIFLEDECVHVCSPLMKDFYQYTIKLSSVHSNTVNLDFNNAPVISHSQEGGMEMNE